MDNKKTYLWEKVMDVDMNNKVSIIIATYRRTDTLKNALESISKQSYNNIEVVLVDDNAKEEWNVKVDAIVKEYQEALDINYIKNIENKGSAETRNIGIKESKGDFITFLDDDDIYLKDKVFNQLEHMVAEKSDFSITDLELVSEKGRTIEKRTREYIKSYKNDDLFKYHLMHHITGTDSMMFKKEYLLSIGGFPGIDVGDEFYLMKNAIDNKGNFSYLPKCDIKAFVHSETDGLSSGDSKINGENALYDFKKKYFNRLDKKSIRYIKMRHYAVLAFAEIRRRNYTGFLGNAIKSFIISPINCIKLLLNR